MNAWIETLPPSKMEYPSALLDRCKYWFWWAYTPLHPWIRDLASRFGILEEYRFAPTGRQDYLLGSLRPERSLQEFVMFLVGQGFGNHFVAWKDDGEIVSLRKTVGFKYQYHLRIFHDGEVRVHYEFTPEYRPLQHLLQVGFEDRISDFRIFVRDWVVLV